jgi:uncharacterized protein
MSRLRIDRLTDRPGHLVHLGDASPLAARCYRANRLVARLTGLLFTPDLAVDEALWIEPCSSVHSFALRAAIGCVFVDAAGTVMRIVDPLPRGRAVSCRGARAVIELPAGKAKALAIGDRVAVS